jgi:hypothetical protein
VLRGVADGEGFPLIARRRIIQAGQINKLAGLRRVGWGELLDLKESKKNTCELLHWNLQ